MTAVGEQLGMSRQNYYARRQQRASAAVEEALAVALGQAERQVRPRLGTRKLMVVLAPELAAAGGGNRAGPVV